MTRCKIIKKQVKKFTQQQPSLDGFGNEVKHEWQTPVNRTASAVTPAARVPVELSKDLGVFFKQHPFDTKIKIDSDACMIYISTEALNKMFYYVGIVDAEVGWYGRVKRLSPLTFLIEEVYLADQDVHATVTEITDEGNTELLTRLAGEDIESVNKLRMWGHSHVNMDTTASGQDETQMKEFSQVNTDYMIRLIANKKGKMSFTIFDYAKSIRVDDAPWCVYVPPCDEMKEAITQEVVAKVFKKTYTTTTYYNQQQYPNQHYAGTPYPGRGAY